MGKDTWKLKRINEILDLPNLSSQYFPTIALITLKERIAEIDEIGALILYGSIVRGEASPKSDIDIMIIPMKEEGKKSLIKQLQRLFTQIESEFNSN